MKVAQAKTQLFDFGAFGVGLFVGACTLVILLLFFDWMNTELIMSDGVIGALGGAAVGSLSAYWTMRRSFELTEQKNIVQGAQAVQVKLFLALSHLEAVKRAIEKGRAEVQNDASARICIGVSGLKPAVAPLSFSAQDSSTLMSFLNGEEKMKGLDFVESYASLYVLFLDFLERQSQLKKKHGIPTILVGNVKRTITIQDAMSFNSEADLLDEEITAIFENVDRLLS
ncbi:MAG: hypothetical protein ACKO96_23510, partial [Flammeovirgaceae bacterium]